jgi:hypothetical protein
MKYHLSYLFLLAACISVSCISEKTSALDKSKWVEYELDNHWIFNAPPKTKIIYLRGIDSVPGNIILKSDSIKLEFDSTFESSMDTICSMSNELVHAKSGIAREDYKYLDRVDTLHTVRIDTIGGMVATIVTPVKTGAGATDIFISNCKSHLGLGIYGKNIPASKAELILGIFKSIRNKKS